MEQGFQKWSLSLEVGTRYDHPMCVGTSIDCCRLSSSRRSLNFRVEGSSLFFEMNIKITEYVDVIIRCKKFQEVIEIRDEIWKICVILFTGT